MGPIRGWIFLLFALFFIFPLHSQSAGKPAALEAELRRLEALAQTGNSVNQREALSQLAGLQELSGDIEGAANSWLSAAQGTPPENTALLRGALCFASLGEWERADAAIRSVLLNNPSRELQLKARLLAAQLEALCSGGINTAALSALLNDTAYAAYHPRISFTLWKITAQDTWRSALARDFPHSPEGRIAAAASGAGITVNALPTAMWLLAPVQRTPAAAQPPVAAPAPAQPPAVPAASPAAQRPAATPATVPAAQLFSRYGTLLQCGFFSREANAQDLAAKLRAAGFTTLTGTETRPGGDYIAVYVLPGTDINASIRQLKAAGFESFPISAP
jgi:tetratricopeptide (TPR) repeat protein